jgi:hypothetical protein
MLRFAWDAALSFSPLPLRLALGLGFLTAGAGVVVGAYAVVQALIHYFGHNPNPSYNPGWATLVTLICLVGGTILICLGILGEYVGRIFEEVKQRPLYIVKAKKNFT